MGECIAIFADTYTLIQNQAYAWNSAGLTTGLSVRIYRTIQGNAAYCFEFTFRSNLHWVIL